MPLDRFRLDPNHPLKRGFLVCPVKMVRISDVVAPTPADKSFINPVTEQSEKKGAKMDGHIGAAVLNRSLGQGDSGLG